MNFTNRLLLILLSLAFLVQGMGNLFVCLEFKLNHAYLERYVCIERGIPNSKCKAHCHLKKQLQSSEGRQNSIKLKDDVEFTLQWHGDIGSEHVYYSKPFNYLPYSITMQVKEIATELFQPPEYV
jgi:hypothetical protein